ncbi:hypothetical protein [Devosia yakushimensis]|nr:hypothetical protein [Devosia yakushimensis]
MSKVGRRHPELVQSRNVALFIELLIDEARQEHGDLAKSMTLATED